MKFNWEDQADLLFDQLEVLIKGRLRAAEYCLKSDAVVVDRAEYAGKIKAFQDALTDVGTLRRVWISE